MCGSRTPRRLRLGPFRIITRFMVFPIFEFGTAARIHFYRSPAPCGKSGSATAFLAYLIPPKAGFATRLAFAPQQNGLALFRQSLDDLDAVPRQKICPCSGTPRARDGGRGQRPV